MSFFDDRGQQVLAGFGLDVDDGERADHLGGDHHGDRGLPGARRPAEQHPTPGAQTVDVEQLMAIAHRGHAEVDLPPDLVVDDDRVAGERRR